jgi:hypothetical protein
MTLETMYGAQFAKQYVNSYLEQDIPQRLIKYRNSWNLDSEALPSPLKYITYEPLALDEWPTIITVAISTKRFDRINYVTNNDPMYSVVYGMRTYIWVRTEGSEQATLMRDQLTTLVRSALLDRPCLMRYDTVREAKIMEETLTEEFSELTLLKGDRVMAGAYLGYDIELEEVITREPYGALDEIEFTAMTMNQLEAQ